MGVSRCDCRANLEEEMDVLKVQAALDRTTVKEQRLCLLNEHQGDLTHTDSAPPTWRLSPWTPAWYTYIGLCRIYIFNMFLNIGKT